MHCGWAGQASIPQRRKCTPVACNTMRHNLPNYSSLKLWEILDSETSLPRGITEIEFGADIKNNTKLRWKVNGSLFKTKTMELLLNDRELKRWKQLSIILTMFIILTIFSISFVVADYWLLITLLFVPLLSIFGLLDYSLFITVIIVLTGVKIFLHISDFHFWFYFVLFLISYFTSRVNCELAKGSILKHVFGDFKTFWKYYANGLIDIDLYSWNVELRRLLSKYPELNS